MALVETDEGQLPDEAAPPQASFTFILCSYNLHEPVTSASKHHAEAWVSMVPDPQPIVTGRPIWLDLTAVLDRKQPVSTRGCHPSAWLSQAEEVHEAILALVSIIGKVVAESSAQPAAVLQPLQQAVTRLHDDAILVSRP